MLSPHLKDQSAQERILPLKAMRDRQKILVHEIYASLQGESSFAGMPCVFVRTTACHLRCNYCDTAHAFSQGRELSEDEVLEQVRSYGISLVEFTGGEPLLQKPVFSLMSRLCDEGYTVLLETSGAVSIEKVDHRVHVILDVKTPGSGEEKRNVFSNLEILWPLCEVKFVICDKADYDYAKIICERYGLYGRCQLLFSAEAENMQKTQLASWIIDDKLPVRFQLQLHKVLWGNQQGV